MNLLNKLQAMSDNAGKVENKALKAAGEPMLADMKSGAPVRTGNLRDGLKISGIKTKGGIKYVEVGITKADNSKIFYAKFFEWGTNKMPARPFMQPAFERNGAQATEIIKQTVREALGL